MNYGLDNYTYHRFDEVPIEQNRLTDIVVEEGQTDSIGDICMIPVRVISEESNSIQGTLLKEKESIRTEYKITHKLKAPVEEGTTVGVTYLVGNEVFKVFPVVTAQGAEKISYSWCIRKILQKTFGFTLIPDFFENIIKS